MKGICVRSEIKPLKKVLLHRPGRELLHLTPDRLPELLFDDIPFLKVAQQEHDAFAQILRSNGAEVVYLEDLMAEVLKLHPEQTKPFLYQWLSEGNIKTRRWQDKLYEYLIGNFEGKALVEKTMEGITLKEMGGASAYSLQDLIAPADDLIVDPMPNLYFTRDPFASVGTGVFLHKMRFPTRCRETIYADYIFRFHPDFEGLVKRYYDRDGHANIEGGDVLNLTEDTLAIGISQRTSPDAIEEASRNLFADPEAKIRTVLAFDIPSCRAFMHLDTVFTQIDYDKYTIHPAILGPLTVYEITPGVSDPTDLHIRRIDSKLEDILAKYTRTDHVQLINCGGDDGYDGLNFNPVFALAETETPVSNPAVTVSDPVDPEGGGESSSGDSQSSQSGKDSGEESGDTGAGCAGGCGSVAAGGIAFLSLGMCAAVWLKNKRRQ